MNKISLLILTVLASAVFSNAQLTPPGAGDKDLRDSNVRGRSNELERIKRDANKPGKRNKNAENSDGSTEDQMAAKYEEIKTDFEQIQKSQDSIIDAYKGGDAINYAKIGTSSQEISKSANRLKSNLFTSVADKIEAEKDPVEKVKITKTIRDLIVELDNTIGLFAASPMFLNLRVIDPAVSEKTGKDLDMIIELSSILNAEAVKMNIK